MADHHRRPDGEVAQEVFFEEPDFLKEILERVLQEILEAQMSERI